MKNSSKKFAYQNSNKACFLYYPNVSSTNVEAKKITEDKIQDWTVIVAQSQKKGYGRKKRHWFSPIGGLYFSLILPQISIKKLQLLTFMAAIAVVKTLRKKFNLKAVVKWPNDVLIPFQDFKTKSESPDFKKIAGILIENEIRGKSKISIVGIGINTNIKKFPKYLSSKATSVAKETGKSVNNEEVLDLFFKAFKKLFKKNSAEILEEYKKYEILIGRRINILTQGKKISGTVFNFDKKGVLVLKLKEGKLIKVLEGSLKFT